MSLGRRPLCVCMAGRMTLPSADSAQDGSGEAGRRRSIRRWLLAVALVTLAAVAAAGVYAVLSSSNSAVTDPLVDRTDRPAPAFSLPELLTPERTVTLAAFNGKPLVINFWASWCFPCQTEMPLLESAYRSNHGSVQFLGIDTDDRRGAAIRFLARVHVTYPSLFMPQRGPVATSYDLIGLPITVFISAHGTVVGRHVGQLNGPTLRAALKLAFGQQAAG
jgi:cytochrome c biogenesis protein CcmG/thiol:disulfide interchange protein DsbE